MQILTCHSPWFLVLLPILAMEGLVLVAHALNLSTIPLSDPHRVATWYGWSRYLRARRYHRRRFILNLVHRSTLLVILSIFLLRGGTVWYQGQCAALALPPLLEGLLFLGTLALIGRIIALPFQALHLFAVEKPWGFSTTSLHTFLADRLKGGFLTLFTAGPAVAMILALFSLFGPAGWLPSAVGWMFLDVVWMTLFPLVIYPLFNTVKPLPEGTLRQAIVRLAMAQTFPPGNIRILDGSRRSVRPNAMTSGLGPTKRIFLLDTLLGGHSDRAVLAVIAHELGHHHFHHSWGLLTFSFAHKIAFFLLVALFFDRTNWLAALGLGATAHAALFLTFLLEGPFLLPLRLAKNAWKRRAELAADAFAEKISGAGAELANLHLALTRDGLFHPTPHPALVLLEYEPPPPLEREAALRSQLTLPLSSGDDYMVIPPLFEDKL